VSFKNTFVPEMTTSTENWKKLNSACKGGDKAACCAIGKLSAQIIDTKGMIKGEKDKSVVLHDIIRLFLHRLIHFLRRRCNVFEK
jgi:hypothetical protein